MHFISDTAFYVLKTSRHLLCASLVSCSFVYLTTVSQVMLGRDASAPHLRMQSSVLLVWSFFRLDNFFSIVTVLKGHVSTLIICLEVLKYLETCD